jgi:hypothetical protein
MTKLGNIIVNKGLIPEYIGIEVELANITTSTLAGLIPKGSGFMSVRDDSIKVVEDVKCTCCDAPHYVVKDRFGAELVSPKIHLSDLATHFNVISKILYAAALLNAKANITTGTHVHIDAAKLDDTALCNTFKTFCFTEDAAFKMFLGDLPVPRVLYSDLYNFSKSMRRFYEFDYVKNGSKAFDKMDSKYWAWYVSKAGHDGVPRYTVEYRLFNSTTNAKKILYMVLYALACSYLGVIGYDAPAPRFFAPDLPLNTEEGEYIKDLIRLGAKLVAEYE